jgi:hypothetical protein
VGSTGERNTLTFPQGCVGDEAATGSIVQRRSALKSGIAARPQAKGVEIAPGYLTVLKEATRRST